MIAIIDYGVGNLRSVEKAFHFIGCDAVITSDVKAASEAECIVLPGVGAFSDAMENLRNAGMVGVVKDAIAANNPFLGICLGMQLLFDYSEEGGSHVEGLGIFRGAIKQLPQDVGLKVPHMGWNSLNMKEASPLFDKIPLNPYVYFVHSFYLAAEDRELVAATVEYGVRFDAAIGRGNVFATQFHPEKSGSIGLDMLRNWAALKPRISAV